MGWLLQSVKTDCRHYVGEKPCHYKRTCPTCPDYAPMGKRILVLKLGAAGDALRTTPILRLFQEKFGNHHVTWATDKVSYNLLVNNPSIDRLVLLSWETALALSAQRFDVLFCADKAPAALALAALVEADEKYGFTLDPNGALTVFDERGTYALWLGLNDPLKFRQNDRTYQDVLFEMFDLTWAEQPYVMELTESEKEQAREKLAVIGATSGPRIGLNTGSGSIFATKKWPAERFVETARALKEKHGGSIVIMGGPAEKERNDAILAKLEGVALDGGCHNPVRIFAAMVAQLDVLVTSDTLAMHLAIAAGVPTIALFGPTAQAEVTLYGKGVKLTGQPDCAPCYKAVCNEEEPFACMKKIEVKDVLAAVEAWLTDSAG